MRLQIERQDFGGIESDWLVRLDDPAIDLSYFADVSRALVGAGESSRAQMLLELLDEQLKADGEWALRLDLLRRSGEHLFGTKRVQGEILESIRKIYAGNRSLPGLMEMLRLEQPQRDPKRVWDLVGRLENLLVFDEETVVYMEGHGVGTIDEVNYELESFKVNIIGRPDVRVGFRAASKVLQPLAESHVLHRKLTEPDELRAMDPPDLLRDLLTSFDRPLTSAEIRDSLADLIRTKQWTSWWNAARKHPQVISHGKSRRTYTWAETSEEARGALWRRFESAEPRTKLEHLRRAQQHDERLQDRMVRSLHRIASDGTSSDPALSFEIWTVMERLDLPSTEEDADPQALVTGERSPSDWLRNIENRTSRERAYGMVRELREDWDEIFSRAAMHESDTRLLASLAEALSEAAPERFEALLRRGLSQAKRQPALFTWVAERAADEPTLRKMALRVFKQLHASLDRDELSQQRNRLLALFDSGGTVPRLLSELDEKEAAEVLRRVGRSGRLTRDQIEALRNAILLRFPDLGTQEQPLYALPASIEAKREELRQVLEEEIPRNRKAIQEAREMGDLRENFEYKSARQRHEFLTSLAENLNRDLQRSRELSLADVDTRQVRIGARVVLKGEDEDRTFSILGPWESAPEEGVVSYESELAQAVLGKREGDKVRIAGASFQIDEITKHPG